MDDDATLREQLRALVRRQLGAEIEACEPIPAGLGLRRFFRLRLRGGDFGSAVARVEAPEDPAGRPGGIAPEPPLEPLRTRLAEAGLPVPARLGGDPAAGIDLLEDVGDLALADAAAEADPAERRALYTEACRIPPRLQRLADPGGVPAFRRHLDRALFAYKAELFQTWSLPAALGRAPRPAEIAAVRAAFERIAETSLAGPQRLAHRDLQSRNLHLRPGAPPGRRLVLLDLQGAFLAPPEYDLVCLLRDSYVELPEEELAAHLAAVRPELPDAPVADTFQSRFDLLTLARKGKDHARFLYAAAERGDARYLVHVPATVRYLRLAARRAASLDPAFARLAELVEALPEDACAR